jgi:hypothetical protein
MLRGGEQFLKRRGIENADRNVIEFGCGQARETRFGPIGNSPEPPFQLEPKKFLLAFFASFLPAFLPALQNGWPQQS